MNGKIDLKTVSDIEWNFIIGKEAKIFEKLSKIQIKLSDIANIFVGLQTSADDVFLLENGKDGKYYSKANNESYDLEDELLKPLCKRSLNIRRYHVSNVHKSILFPYEFHSGKANLISKNVLSKKYPNIWKYLIKNRIRLESRENGKWKNNHWYAFGTNPEYELNGTNENFDTKHCKFCIVYFR